MLPATHDTYGQYYYHYWSTYPYSYAIHEPKRCIGKAHVFEREHATQCQCGAVERAMRAKGE